MRGAAWTAPVLAISAAAPIASASTVVPPVRPTTASVACKITAGVMRYHFTLVFKNTLATATTLCITAGTMDGNGCDADLDLTTASPSACLTIAAGKTGKITVDSVRASCLSNGMLTATYTYTDATGKIVLATTATGFNDVKTC